MHTLKSIDHWLRCPKKLPYAETERGSVGRSINRNKWSYLMLVTLLGLFASLATTASSNETKGTVCLGNNLALPSEEHSDRLYLRIDDSPRIYFVRPYRGPRVVARNLDVHKEHTVRVYFDHQQVQSWTLNFPKLNTDSVLVWRSSGAWRMEPNDTSSCK